MNILIRTMVSLCMCVIPFSSCKKDCEMPKEETLVLNPHQNPSELLIFGGSSVDRTTDDAAEILAGAGTYLGQNVAIRSALKFDLAAIPENAIIVSAKLTLYSNPTPINGQEGKSNSGVNNTLLFQRITSDWTASSATWANQPVATTTDQVAVAHSVLSVEDVKDVDVSVLVKKMISDGNYGFLFKLQTENIYTFRIFCSSRYADQNKHPKLEIVYREN